MQLFFQPYTNVAGSAVQGFASHAGTPPTTSVILTPASVSPWTVPAGVTQIYVEAWGSGGEGGGATVGASGSGGGGGGYCAKLLNVTPGAMIPFVVDVEGGAGQTYWDAGGDVLATSGQLGGVVGATDGIGGQGANTGTVYFSGGNGGPGQIGAGTAGGGGGGSAGPGGNGGAGFNGNGNTPGAGGIAAAGGGNGSLGGVSGADGPAATTPGGGSGGGGDGGSSGGVQAGDGQIRITYAV